MSLCVIKFRFLFSSHDYYSDFDKDANRQETAQSLVQVCVQRVIRFGPMESVINSGHCTVDRVDSHLLCMCQYVFVHVRVCVLLECWLSCVVKNIRTVKCQMQVLVSTLCTHLSVCE